MTASSRKNNTEIAQQYISSLQNKKPLLNGNFYSSSTALIDFDFSIKSLSKLDILLQAIRETEYITEQDYSLFIQHPEKLNFIVAMTYYLGGCLAHHSQSSMQWLDFEEYKLHSNIDSQVEFQIQLNQVCLFDQHFIFPMQTITKILFNTLTSEQSCVDFVLNFSQNQQSSIRYFPSLLRFSKVENFPINIKQSFELAGFLAAYASNHIIEEKVLKPLLLQPTKNGMQLTHLENNHSKFIKDKHLDKNVNKLPFIVYCESDIAYLPSGQTNVISLNIRIYESTPIDFILMIPYQYNYSKDSLIINSAFHYNLSDLSDQLTELAMALFYKQAFEYINPANQTKLWEQIFEETIVFKPNTDLVSVEDLYDIKKQFIWHLNTDYQNNMKHHKLDDYKIYNDVLEINSLKEDDQNLDKPNANKIFSSKNRYQEVLEFLNSNNQIASNSLITIINDPDIVYEQKRVAVELLQTQASKHDLEAMQVMSDYYARGQYVEKNRKYALYLLTQIAKVTLDDEEYKTVINFLSSSANGNNPEDKQISQWLQELADHFEKTNLSLAVCTPQNFSTVEHIVSKDEIGGPIKQQRKKNNRRTLGICILLLFLIIGFIFLFLNVFSVIQIAPDFLDIF